MKSTYYEQADILHILLSYEAIIRETSQENAWVGFSADGQVTSIVLREVRKNGVLLQPRIKVPWPKRDCHWEALLEAWQAPKAE